MDRPAGGPPLHPGGPWLEEQLVPESISSGMPSAVGAQRREGLGVAADKVRGSWGACVALYERLKVFLYQRTGCGGTDNMVV